MNCDCCKEEKEKGYYRNPKTGRESKVFLCDDCYEREFRREWHGKAHLEHVDSFTKIKRE